MKVNFTPPKTLTDNLLSSTLKFEYLPEEVKNVCALQVKVIPENLKILQVFPVSSNGTISATIIAPGHAVIKWSDTKPYQGEDIAVIIMQGTPEKLIIDKEYTQISSPGDIKKEVILEDLVISLS